jgi:hypothetical protein
VDSDFDRPEDEEDTEEQASKLVEDAERMERRRKVQNKYVFGSLNFCSLETQTEAVART